MDSSAVELRRRIKDVFWPRLTRQLTREKVKDAAYDSKAPKDSAPRLFVAQGDSSDEAFKYYSHDAAIAVERLRSPSQFDDDYLFKIAHEPGLLAMAFADGAPVPYIVPGGRFNEFYGWDSYFIARGLMEDNFWDEAADVATQFAFEIDAFGQVLNANRPYYLGRTHPPFLTDLAWRLQPRFASQFPKWMRAAIHEYHSVWTSAQRFDPKTTLSRYTAAGRGLPPEVEPGHFDAVLRPFAERCGLSIKEFSERYDAGELQEPALDDFLRHDRAVRESGHDVSTRTFGVCADLATVDLASLLYKYEIDIARAVSEFPSDFPGQDARQWTARAEARRKSMTEYLWNEKAGCFCDYNVAKQTRHNPCTSATTFWPLWSGCASPDQAATIVQRALPQLEFKGGLASTSNLPDSGKQWDYPAGWAPHQILAWEGLEKYGFHRDACRLANSWQAVVLKGYELTDGAVFEKYDVTDVDAPQDVRSEYGNQGNSHTGFGWTNASYAIAWNKFSSAS